MSSSSYVFTSESVSEGHPDKVCDRISDSIVDLYLKADPHSRVAVETLATTNTVVMAGEVRGPDSIGPHDLEVAAREAIRSIGYAQKGFHWGTVKIDVLVHSHGR
jgi:S-adenosylmethionine synthetase